MKLIKLKLPSVLIGLLLTFTIQAQSLSETWVNLPSPMVFILHPVTYAILVMYAGLLLWETVAPRRKLPAVEGWWLKGMITFICYFMLASYLPLFWDHFLARWALFDLTALAYIWQFLIGLVVYELMFYAWHRSMHSSHFLWRALHQMHHSAERIDVPSAFYLSIWDMVGFILMGSLALVFVVGLSAQAATWVILVTNFLAIFQHSNIKTPRWLGYLIQRPENHSLHHAKGVHYYNFSDISLIDMLFGTFRNSPNGAKENGFNMGASNRVLDMHMMQDVAAGDAYYFKQGEQKIDPNSATQ